MCPYVCLSVCLFIRISQKPLVQTLFVQARAVSRSFSDDYDVRYAHRDAVRLGCGRVGPRNHVLGGTLIPDESGNFWGS